MPTQPRLCTLADAAQISGRSVDTIRRWIKGGKLKDRRTKGDRKSAVQVAYEDLVALLADTTPPAPGDGVAMPRHAQASVEAELRARVGTLERLVDELAAERNRTLAEAERLRQELTESRRVIAELQRRLEAPTGRRLLSWLGLGK